MRAHFNWKLALFVVLCLPVLLRLGFWQLERAEEKRQILAEQQAMMALPAADYLSLTDDERQNYRQIRARAVLQPQLFLLDNQIYRGRFGYEVIQPASLADGSSLFVSRGWIAGSLDRRILPQIEQPEGELLLVGYLYQPRAGLELAQSSIGEQWPQVIQSIDLEKLYKASGKTAKIAPLFLLRLDAHSPAALERHWQLINVQPEKHTGYAVQWFGMAILLVVLFLLASIGRTAVKRET